MIVENGTTQMVAQGKRRRAPGLILLAVVMAASVLSADPTPAQSPGQGRVHLDGHAFADDGGPFNALGASLFWALWGERHDTERLDANLAHLAAHDVDYVRILAMVGARTWEDRVIDPGWPDYWAVVDRLFERLGRHGLRAHVTVFADAQVMMPDPAARDAFVTAWASRLEQWNAQVLFAEIANEHWQNGLADIEELTRHGEALRASTAVPVALSAPRDHEVARVYAGWPGVATMHFNRSVSGDAGPLGPVVEPWRWPEDYFDRATTAPPVFVNAEPIGPDSSVAEDADPARIALAYVTTLLAGGAGYTYHPGAGVRGGGAYDLGLGRHANVFDYDTRIIEALAHWRRSLPPGLANGERRHARWTRPRAEFPWTGFDEAIERGDLTAAYASVVDDRIMGVILGPARPFTVEARWALDQRLLDPVSGDVIQTMQLDTGDEWEVPAAAEGYVIDATRR